MERLTTTATKTTLLERLLPLRRIFAHAAIGDFSQDVVIPENDEELAEVYVGVHVMLNVIRQTITELQTTNLHLQQQIIRLAQAQAKDEALFASIGEGIIATDKLGNIILLNQTGAQILGIEPATVIGQPLDRAIILTDAMGTPLPQSERLYWRALQTGQRIVVTNFSIYYRRSDGTLVPVAVTASPILLEGETIGVVNTFRDLSHEKAINHSKNDFLAVASHQLKTPLTMINWHTQRLLHNEINLSSEKKQNALLDIQTGVTRLNAMYNAILMVSELQLGTICVTCCQTNLQPLVENVMSKLHNRAQIKSIMLEQAIPGDLPAVNADEKLLLNVLEALVNNAITYTPSSGRVRLQVEFVGHRDQTQTPTSHGKVIIKLTDTGIGIPMHQQGNIFTKLFRADNAKQIEPGGTGLSLFIAKAIIELMEGEIWFDSQEGRGTTFFIALPVSAEV